MRKLRCLALVTALALAGCSTPAGGDGGVAGPSRSPSASAASDPAANQVQVDKSYWYGGFKATLGTARIVPSSFGGNAVTIEGVFQNLSPRYAATPTLNLLLAVGDRTYADVDHPLLDMPEIPAQRSAHGTYAFDVDEHFDLAEAVLIVGNPSGRQAIVPLTGPEGLVALEPTPVPVTGKVVRDKSGTEFMTVTGVEVRADEPLLHGEAPSGSEFLRLTFSATNNSAAGFAWVFDRDLHLKLPDGTSIGTADNCSRAQIYPPPHATATGGLACFLIPAPAAGAYLLSWDGNEKGALRVPVS